MCAIGLEKVLARDLAHLGFREVGRSAGRVVFNVSTNALAEDLAKANIGLRTADRVLLVVGEFKAFDFDGFYQGIYSLPWEAFCAKDTRVLIERARANGCKLHAQATLQSMAQKAIYAALMEHFHVRNMPETGRMLEVRIYGDNDWWQIVIDTSGEALSRRGYRRFTHEAPLKETIAASLLFLAGWSRSRPLIDPFCGSGTIPIEAALYACNAAPGLKRRFAFEDFPEMDQNKVEDMRLFFRQQVRRDIRTDIRASDLDTKALELARRNATLAGISEFIKFSNADARELVPPEAAIRSAEVRGDMAQSGIVTAGAASPGAASGPPAGTRGIMLANPPYGQRLASPDEARALYRELSPMLKRYLDAGWECGFLSADKEFGEAIGVEPTSVRMIVSGQETIFFNWFSAGIAEAGGHAPRSSNEHRRSRAPISPNEHRSGRPSGSPQADPQRRPSGSPQEIRQGRAPRSPSQ